MTPNKLKSTVVLHIGQPVKIVVAEPDRVIVAEHFKKLGEETLITKGTLTGVISRLEDKALVQRVASETDGRSQIVRLTAKGESLYERTFPEHLAFIYRIFNDYSPEDIATLEAALLRLRNAVITARSDGSGELADKTNGWCAKVKDVCKHYQDGLDDVI